MVYTYFNKFKGWGDFAVGVHDGHRDRLKKRFWEQGLDGFEDHNVLELLLFFAMPRCDTNPTAHALLDAFGSLSGVMEASPDELRAVDGVGENAATLMRLIPAVCRRYMTDRENSFDVIDVSEKAAVMLLPRYLLERDEVVYIMCLDSKNKLLCCRELFRGVVNSAEISIRKIAELALAKNASGVIISHNHISGIALPSAEDEYTTKKLCSALEAIGITLVDHIIVAGDDYISMKDSRLF